MSGQSLALPALTNLTDEEFIEHWEQMAALQSVIDGRQRELKMMAQMKFLRGEGIQGGGRELSSTQQSRTTYDMVQVAELIPQEDLLPLLTVNKGKLDGYSRDNPRLRSELNRIAQVSYNAPTYRIKKLKKEDSDDVERELPDFDEDCGAA